MVDLTNLDRDEVRVLRRGLKRLRYETRKAIARTQRTGWKPEEGKIDLNVATMATIESLLDRLPFPQYPVDITKDISNENHR